ncbi:MAG: family 16 glycoside hydrolase [Kiritimatiellia bacterium]
MNVSIILLNLMLALSLCAQTNLFNGKDLTGWKRAEIIDNGEIKVLPDGIVECNVGRPISGIAYTNEFPTMNYELSLEAMRVKGDDFFIALTIPVEKSFCTVIIGGWGGGLCGISSYDGGDAANNQWAEGVTLKNNRWYKLVVRVTTCVLQISLDQDLYTARIEFDDSRRFSLRSGDMDKTIPLGLATYETKAHWRNFTMTPITELRTEDKPHAAE